jgi:Na+/melibiose symporter-like transporter
MSTAADARSPVRLSFGYLTDDTRSRMGRRIPFLALFFIMVWFAPRGAGQIGIFARMLASMLLYDTAYTIIGLAYSALLPEVSQSNPERNGLQISSSLFGLLGTLLGFMIPDLVRPKEAGGTLTFRSRSFVVLAFRFVPLIVGVTFTPIFEALILARYPLRGRRLEQMQRKILDLHAQRKRATGRAGHVAACPRLRDFGGTP